MIPRFLIHWKRSDVIHLAIPFACGIAVVVIKLALTTGTTVGTMFIVLGAAIAGLLFNVAMRHLIVVRPRVIRARKAQMLQRIQGKVKDEPFRFPPV